MRPTKRRVVAGPMPRLSTKKVLIASAVASMLGVSSSSFAQSDDTAAGGELEEVVVTGIRASLRDALSEKRESANLKEVIIAEDIGKLPDQNLAEVLENITGIQITRTAGVGTGVQIRGTNSNRVEFNGVSTVDAGSGRSGISFEDVNPAIIAAVEVIKSPEAKTIEGSVGGTVNLRTIRPLDLTESIGSVRVQFEDSSLSTESLQPRVSGAYGDNWVTDAGQFGFFVAGSYTEQEAVSFRPRADRDNLGTNSSGGAPEEFLGIQFLLQEQENDDFETTNLVGTFEWAPNDNLKFYFDAIINDQEQSRDQYRLQASGVSTLIDISVPTAFETVDFGPFGGPRAAALQGTLEPDLANDDDDPNLRFTTETSSRVTDSEVFAIGGEWGNDRWTIAAQLASTSSSTRSPTLNTTLNFINPNCPLDGSSNDNCVPFIYDLSGGTLAFDVNFDSPFAPTEADLLNPANVVLDAASVTNNFQENEEDAARIDLSYAFGETGVTSVDFGVRYNESSSQFQRNNDSFSFSQLEDSPNGLLFQELLIAGPTNFGSADGRDLFIDNFLLVDPDRSFEDQQGVIDILENALAQHRLANPEADGALTLDPFDFDENAFFDVEEETTALYAQVNFEYGIVRGNVGARYIDTDITSTAFGPQDGNGNRQLQSSTGSYDFVLPRFNLVVQPSDELIFRLGYGEDIRRPNFNNLNTAFTLPTSENAAIVLGNPGLEPEEVESFDVTAEWYFAPSAVATIGYFRKERTNIFGQDFQGAALIQDPTVPGGLARETDPSCPGGGIFNPAVVPNVLGDPNTLGLCVDFTIPGNDPDTTTQDGIELAFQYDLSNFEDSLGWASGFGFIVNATFQDFSGGSLIDTTSGRGEDVLGDQSIPRGLVDFSETAYNFTLFYEKYGLSARARYTWREAFRTFDFGGGANTSGSSTFSFPVVTDDRGQLNASISYDITDRINVGVEAVNLTEEGIDQNCVVDTGPLCFVGLPDRRIIFGGSYRF